MWNCDRDLDLRMDKHTLFSNERRTMPVVSEPHSYLGCEQRTGEGDPQMDLLLGLLVGENAREESDVTFLCSQISGTDWLANGLYVMDRLSGVVGLGLSVLHSGRFLVQLRPLCSNFEKPTERITGQVFTDW